MNQTRAQRKVLAEHIRKNEKVAEHAGILEVKVEGENTKPFSVERVINGGIRYEISPNGTELSGYISGILFPNESLMKYHAKIEAEKMYHVPWYKFTMRHPEINVNFKESPGTEIAQKRYGKCRAEAFQEYGKKQNEKFN
ncbi:MAG: hypothetical protein WDZ77_00010 [Candidatus Pacearchaeota archaeon]